MKNIAVVLAGGSGRRFSSKINKQFFLINGKPLLAYTIEKFNSLAEIDEIVVASASDLVQRVKNMVEKYRFDKVLSIVQGGEERFDSVYASLKACENDEDAKVLIHDGARPLVSHSLIKKCISCLDSFSACVPLTKEKNTIFQVENEKILNLIDRNILYCAQTPQCFILSLIKKAYDIAINTKKEKLFTDDCSVLRTFLPEVEVKMITGEEENIKITVLQDAKYMEFLLANQKKFFEEGDF